MKHFITLSVCLKVQSKITFKQTRSADTISSLVVISCRLQQTKHKERMEEIAVFLKLMAYLCKSDIVGIKLVRMCKLSVFYCDLL